MGTNTGLGIGIGIPFKNNALGGDKPYFPPELKARLIGVWDNYGKKNTDADRNIIKNKIPNAGGDLEILNAAYKLNSGFGEYKEDFTSWRIYPNIEVTDNVITTNGNFNSTWFIYKHADENEINEINIKVSGIPEGGKILYLYIPDETATMPVSYNISEDGVYHLPKSKLSSNRVSVGFTVSSSYDWNNIRIEQLSDFGGAFVTDGINDMIISQKTLQEMGVTKELTIVSMIHQISFRNSTSVPLTNYIRPTDNIYARNQIADIGKTGIYGYVVYDIKNSTVGNSHIVNTILGDKNDYSIYTIGDLSQGKFSVQGYIDGNGNIRETSSVAHYWTFAVLGKATEDEINLIIGNYNLDRSLKPDILCNIGKQGITNDNHADFNDKLVDYSGNGRDVQMNNLAWKGGSGIAAKPYETFKDWTSESSSTSIITQIDEFTRIVESTTNGYWVSRIRRNSDLDKVYSPINVYLYQDNNFLVHECKYEVDGVKYAIPINEPVGKGYHKLEMYTKDRYTELPENAENVVLSEWYFPKSTKGSIKYSIIPSCKGGILLDGINDFGKVTGMPVYKDYTVVADYERLDKNLTNSGSSSILSKAYTSGQGAFLLNHWDELGKKNHCYSFGKDNVFQLDDSDKKIYYQSKYSNQGIYINTGSAKDGTDMWLGTIRDNDNRFFNGAIYSLMSFPYSMSKFLIERQLKKYKLGTLYPNMVEFRPIIKSNVNYQDIIFRNTSTGENLIVGQYYNLESISIYVKPLYYEEVSTIKVNNINAEFNSYDKNTGYYRFDCIVTKSPQKINLTIEQDENYVQWNPVITANVSNYIVSANIRKTDGTTIKLIEGDYYLISITGNLVLDIVPPNKDIDKVTNVIIDGESYTPIKYSNTDYYRVEIPLVFPKEIDITIDEYIRYEDIVQPYPILLRFNDENGNEVSWGGKFRVGSTITRIGSAADSNLLPNIYNIFGLLLNDNQVTSSKVIVEKTMVFKAKSAYIFDNNEPKCILSPSRLRIPNSSYKLLGYIPDISGHGNHGKINNSAYAGASGANGYLLDFKTFTTGNSSLVNIKDDSIIEVINTNKEKGSTYINLNKHTSTNLSSWKIKVTGMKSGDTLAYYYSESTDATLRSRFEIKSDGIYSLPSSIANSNKIGGIAFDVVAVADSAYRMEQIGEYEGAYCLDGVDDFVTIPTTVGGKQMLMKVNWQKSPTLLYDQRASGSFAVLTTNEDDAVNSRIAYQGRNQGGKTYIDGIENNNIETYTLKDITHNITIANSSLGGVIVPVIGCNTGKTSNFAKMSLYDFMLFDEISTDDKIKELNEYVGIEAKVELPPYYWDTYGKTNSDADRDTIQQRGVAVGDYDLTNYNHAYEGMSGYNGYPVVFGIGKTYGGMPSIADFAFTTTPITVNVTRFNTTHGLIYSYLKRNGVLENQNTDYPSYNIRVTGIEEGFDLRYYYLESPSDVSVNEFVMDADGIYTIPKSFASDGSLINNNVWIGFIFIGTAPESCNVTIEMLPLYPNGLVYDGVTDYSNNNNIPALTDFTAIAKRKRISDKLEGFTVAKGDKVYAEGNGNGFLMEWDTTQQFSFGGKSIIDASKIPDLISYITPTSYNGETITKGTGIDTNSLYIAGNNSVTNYTKMVFYKLILYPKTIPLLQINFLKNLMEKDEIIDLNNPIFIKNE